MTYLESVVALHNRYVNAISNGTRMEVERLNRVLTNLAMYQQRYTIALNLSETAEVTNSENKIKEILTNEELTVTDGGFLS